jgi:hypothetical protein
VFPGRPSALGEFMLHIVAKLQPESVFSRGLAGEITDRAEMAEFQALSEAHGSHALKLCGAVRVIADSEKVAIVDDSDLLMFQGTGEELTVHWERDEHVDDEQADDSCDESPAPRKRLVASLAASE